MALDGMLAEKILNLSDFKMQRLSKASVNKAIPPISELDIEQS